MYRKDDKNKKRGLGMTVVGREVVAAKASRSTHLKWNREITILTINKNSTLLTHTSWVLAQLADQLLPTPWGASSNMAILIENIF